MSSTCNERFQEEFNSIRRDIESLHIPRGVYGYIEQDDKGTTLYQVGGEFGPLQKSIESKDRDILEWLQEHSQEENIKLIAVGMERSTFESLNSHLWLDHDIVPFIFDNTDENTQSLDGIALAQYIESQFNATYIQTIDHSKTREVNPSYLVSKDDYYSITDDTTREQIESGAEKVRGKRIMYISATAQGGGVALMRHALIRLYRLLGVDAHWNVLIPNNSAFKVTKTKFHNILHGIAGDKVGLTQEDIEIYEAWIQDNYSLMKPDIKSSDIIVIDDPQPSGLIPYIEKDFPHIKIVYRSHIQLDTVKIDKEGTPQHKVWQYLWNFIKQAEVFISHPVTSFVPKIVPQNTVVYMPPTTDPLDGLNKKLTDDQSRYYMNMFNKLLLEQAQSPLDPERPYIVQIARFDPSKGIPDVVEVYKKLREKIRENDEDIPQLVLAGHGSVDDPDGTLVRKLLEKQLQDPKYHDIRDDIKRIHLPHIDQLLNILLRNAHIALQLSYREGYEIKVSEAIVKGIPIIIYNTGGMPLQVKDSETGYICEPGDIDKVVEHMHMLLTDEKQYLKISNNAKNSEHAGIYTTGNARAWLDIFAKLI